MHNTVVEADNYVFGGYVNCGELGTFQEQRDIFLEGEWDLRWVTTPVPAKDVEKSEVVVDVEDILKGNIYEMQVRIYKQFRSRC
jgi:hypothetical protein